MRRATVTLLLSVSLGALAAHADTTMVREIRPGVTHITLVRREGPWRINVLAIDVRQSGLSLRSARAFDRLRGRETTSSIADRFPVSDGAVVAAMNADFFSLETGESVNSQVIEGTFVKGIGGRRARPRSQFGVTWAGRPFIARTMYRGVALLPDGGRVPLGGVNILPDSGWGTLFNRYYGEQVPDSVRSRALVKLPLSGVGKRGDTLLFVCFPLLRGGESSEAVLAVRVGELSAVLSPLLPGDTIRVLDDTEPHVGPIRTLVGGAPRIVLDGKNIAGVAEFLEGTSMEFSSRRHPRTGVGFSRDSSTVYFLVVDGRQSGSAGMTLPEFAALMIEQGVFEGVNLDGGGSSVMVVEGEIMNSPSDAAGERPVANCLLLIAEPRQKELE